jgi:hypothetical protein
VIEPPEVHPDAKHPHEEFFAPWREARSIRYAGKPRRRLRRRRKAAVMTLAHNESVFLPIWLRFYSRFFRARDIYVLDNDTSDGSTDGRGFVRVPVSHDRIDMRWMVDTVAAFQRELLESYDVVLFSDADEIVTPIPEWGNLGDYVQRLDEEFVNPLGYELLHLRDREPPLDLTRPVLDQRGYWFAHDGYDKPILATVPMDWVEGFHASADGRKNYDPDLRLIHLRRMDYDISLARQQQRAQRRWDERDVSERWAAYNQVQDEAAYERWFYRETGFDEAGIHIVLEPIAPAWRGLV